MKDTGTQIALRCSKWVSLDELRKEFDEHSNCKRQSDCCFEELKKRFFAHETKKKDEVTK